MPEISFSKRVMNNVIGEQKVIQHIATTIALIVEGNTYIYKINDTEYQIGRGNDFWLKCNNEGYF